MNMRTETRKLGELVVHAGLASSLQIDHALQSQHVFGGSLGTNLVEMGIIDAGSLAAFLSQQYGVPIATADEIDHVSPQTIALVPKAAAERLCLLPLQKNQDGLVVAMMDPSDARLLAKIESNLGMPLICKIASELEIRKGLKKYYQIPLTARFLHLISQKDKPNIGFLQSDDLNHEVDLHLDRVIPTAKAISVYFERIGSLEKVPVVAEVKDITSYHLSPALVFIFQQIDGVSTIEEIIGFNIFSKLNTLRSIVYLYDLGMIRFLEGR